MALRDFFNKTKRIAELKAKNKKLIEDNRYQSEQYFKLVNEYHIISAELEQLKFKDSLNSAKIASDHKIYQDGLNMGKSIVAEDLREVMDMSYEELVEYSNDACLNGQMWVALAENENENEGKWEVHDRICQYGGCEMPFYCKDERLARIYVATMNLSKMPLIRDICDECKKEYYGISADDVEDF